MNTISGNEAVDIAGKSPVFFFLLIILGVEHGGKPFFKQKGSI